MSYYGQGDYYRRGDPFSLGGILSGGLKALGSVAKVIPGIGGVVGGVLTGAGNVLANAGGPAKPQFMGISAGGAGSGTPVVVGGSGSGTIVKKPGVRGVIERLLPGGSTGFEFQKSRRMNVVNPRALRRAIRRVSGFGKLVQRSKRAIAKANTAVGNKSRRR